MDRERERIKGAKSDDMRVLAIKERNSIRKILHRNFASIRVWLFRQPAEPATLQQHKVSCEAVQTSHSPLSSINSLNKYHIPSPRTLFSSYYHLTSYSPLNNPFLGAARR
jgi:hypothetical protein